LHHYPHLEPGVRHRMRPRGLRRRVLVAALGFEEERGPFEKEFAVACALSIVLRSTATRFEAIMSFVTSRDCSSIEVSARFRNRWGVMPAARLLGC
jgi:hypothetical protein